MQATCTCRNQTAYQYRKQTAQPKKKRFTSFIETANRFQTFLAAKRSTICKNELVSCAKDAHLPYKSKRKAIVVLAIDPISLKYLHGRFFYIGIHIFTQGNHYRYLFWRKLQFLLFISEKDAFFGHSPSSNSSQQTQKSLTFPTPSSHIQQQHLKET